MKNEVSLLSFVELMGRACPVMLPNTFSLSDKEESLRDTPKETPLAELIPETLTGWSLSVWIQGVMPVLCTEYSV